MEQVKLVPGNRFALLRPGYYPARTGDSYQQINPDVRDVIKSARQSYFLVVDFEANGTDYSDPTVKAVGVALAWDKGSAYFSLSALSASDRGGIYDLLLSHPRLVAHNIYYDGGLLFASEGRHANWAFCTLGLYKQLAGEGWTGQAWGLKSAMTDLLMWADTNERELDEWLVLNGYHKRNKSPEKSMMYLAPAEILGKYAVLDAEATYLILTKVLLPALERFPILAEFHQREHIHLIVRLIEQRLEGILLDRLQLLRHKAHLEKEMEARKAAFRTHEKTGPLILEFERMKLAEHLAKEPEKFLKKKGGDEPKKCKKGGGLSKAWLRWKELADAPPVVSKNWLKWHEKGKLIEAGQHEDYLFNVASGDHLRWLFYDKLNMPIRMETDSGLPSTSTDALTQMGSIAKPLVDYAFLYKEYTYVVDYLERTENRPTLHPSYNVPGTVTGRLSGSEPNMQQCFAPETEVLTKAGWKLIKDLGVGELVMAVHPDSLQGDWLPVEQVTSREFEGELSCYGRAHKHSALKVTPDHRMLFVGDPTCHISQAGRRIYKRAGEAWSTRSVGMAHSVLDNSRSNYAVDDIWRTCMVQAAGSSARMVNPFIWRFGFRKERKIKKAEELIGVPAKRIDKKNTYCWDRFDFKHPLLKEDKTFDLSTLGANQAEDFVQALAFWDGTPRNTQAGAIDFSCNNKQVIDEVQAYLVRSGWHARISSFKRGPNTYYNLYIKPGYYREYRRTNNYWTEPYKGPVYCLSVPTTFILVRSGYLTYVTGQCPKTKPTLSGFIAPEGWSFVDCDVNALEMVVAAELSQDKNLLSLYGPSARKNDVYLFWSAQLPVIGPKIRATGYDPFNPTQEAIDRAKKECKLERSVGKLLVLSDSYGSGIEKKLEILRLEGINLSYEDVEAMHEALQSAKSGVIRFQDRLLKEWRQNGGWVLDGLGHPTCVDASRRKDLWSRVVQKTGHSILVMYIRIWRELLDQEDIPWKPIIIDWHDESIVMVPDKYVERTKFLLEIEAFRKLNEELGGTCPLKGSAAVSKTLAGIKLEE